MYIFLNYLTNIYAFLLMCPMQITKDVKAQDTTLDQKLNRLTKQKTFYALFSAGDSFCSVPTLDKNRLYRKWMHNILLTLLFKEEA